MTKFEKLKRRIIEHRVYYAMLIPGIVLNCIFCSTPMYGVVLAFKDYFIRKGIMGSPFADPLFKHFTALFDIPQFWVSLKNTILHNVLKLIFGFPVPIIIAIMLNLMRKKLVRNTIQTILYLPHFVSWVVVSGIVFAMLNDGGYIKTFFNWIGLENYDILADDTGFLGLIVVSDTWKEAGWGSIIYFSALTSISGEYYEAAKVDGASEWKMLWAITLPLLVPTISIMLILRVGEMMSSGMDQIYNLYNEQVYDVADNLATFTYRYGIGKGNFEQGTAIGLFTNVINIILLFIANRVTKLLGGEALYWYGNL